MNEIHVIENIIPTHLQDDIEAKLLHHDFPVYLGKETIEKTDPKFINDQNTKDYMMFNHIFVINSEITSSWYNLIHCISQELSAHLGLANTLPHRCKLNITFPNREFADTDYFPSHYDAPRKSITGVYYVNDSDGDTLFFENPDESPLVITEQYTPKKGSLVYFDNSVLHSWRPPKNTRVRCVINFLFLL
jgi:hypothetical protein